MGLDPRKDNKSRAFPRITKSSGAIGLGGTRDNGRTDAGGVNLYIHQRKATNITSSSFHGHRFLHMVMPKI